MVGGRRNPLRRLQGPQEQLACKHILEVHHQAPVKDLWWSSFANIINSLYIYIYIYIYIFIKTLIFNRVTNTPLTFQRPEMAIVLFWKVAVLKSSELPWIISTEVFFLFIILNYTEVFGDFTVGFPSSPEMYLGHCQTSVMDHFLLLIIFAKTFYYGCLTKSNYASAAFLWNNCE